MYYKLLFKNKIFLLSRLELFQSLTENGKDILYLEENVGMFLLDWMTVIFNAGKELDYLNILITCIKYNASYFDEDIICGIVEYVKFKLFQNTPCLVYCFWIFKINVLFLGKLVLCVVTARRNKLLLIVWISLI